MEKFLTKKNNIFVALPIQAKEAKYLGFVLKQAKEATYLGLVGKKENQKIKIERTKYIFVT